MLKSKVIHSILEACGAAERPGAGGRPGPGARSPAAGGGLAGAPPPARKRAAHVAVRDPRLGQSTAASRPVRRRSRRA